ncbi:MFS transporter [Paenibacillus sp. BSR1-1]|uniref:MFS transporter n=1 Tax=Paenibacillus sp. BSR1-1 TaxID=3020845 RepID=UPI0025B03FED|nr:MFS transporter [Paenibacillus sp. BSR1-1]MDN3019082.1 MFS transporter [Paenibacillus sp. BSR1-1]
MAKLQKEVMQNVQQAKSINKTRWAMVMIILVGAVVNYLDRSNLSVANPLISKEFGLSPLQMGVLLSAFLWPYALANLPAGWLVDKIGPKKMLTGAMGSWSIVSLLAAFTNSYSIFYTLRVLLGISESPFFPSATKAINTWFSKKDRGTPLAIVNTGSQIANGIAPPLLTALMLAYSWKIMFVIIGAAGLVVMAVWWSVYRNPTKFELIEINKDEEEVKVDAAEKQIGWGGLFKYKSTWFMIIGNFGLVYTMWTFLTWLPGYLVADRGLTVLKTGWVASIPFLMGIIGVPLGGIISDYFIRKGYQPIKARKIPLVCGAIVAACAVIPIPYVSGVTGAITLITIAYFASSVPTGVIWTLATDVAPKNMVASLGSIQNFGGFVGASLAPIVTGAIVQTTGSFEYVFLVGAVLLVVSAVSYGIFLKKPITVK